MRGLHREAYLEFAELSLVLLTSGASLAKCMLCDCCDVRRKLRRAKYVHADVLFVGGLVHAPQRKVLFCCVAMGHSNQRRHDASPVRH
jgi:hypothetical protein